MAFQLARRARIVMLMVSELPESGLAGAPQPAHAQPPRAPARTPSTPHPARTPSLTRAASVQR